MARVLAVLAVAAMLCSAAALPDMVLDVNRLAASLAIRVRGFTSSSCPYQEGCVTGTGTRRLLAFDTATPNIGTTDLYIGTPGNSLVWDNCHRHYHYEGYAKYTLYDVNGDLATTGRKQAFCLMDSSHYHGYTGGSFVRPYARYHCQDQGISVGWQDVYYSGLDCQWIDITDVPDGLYTLRVELNAPDELGNRKIQELRYDNNAYEVSVTVSGSGANGGSTQCNVGQWSSWSACSVSCNSGVRTRSRTVTGSNCPESFDTEGCNEHPCGGGTAVSTDGRCGNNHPDFASCPGSQCCSQYGWCGTSSAHCQNAQDTSGGGGSSSGSSSGSTDGSSSGSTDGSSSGSTDGSNSGSTDGSNSGSTDGSGSGSTDGSGSGSTDGNTGGNTGGGGAMCENCWPGTSGHCKVPVGVCYDYFPGTTMCPGGTTQCHSPVEDIDCVADPWTAWGECSVACGGGTQIRRRIVARPPSGNGAACPSPLEESRSCNPEACDNTDNGSPVDCLTDQWSAWSDCDVTCGGGTAVRRRTVIVAPQNGGEACPGLEQFRSCNNEACTDDVMCQNCFPGTSGPCKSYNNVCWARHPDNGMCPAGTTPCATSAAVNAASTSKVTFEVTLAGITSEDYLDNVGDLNTLLASKLDVIPPAMHVATVSNGGVTAAGGRRLHGGGPVPAGAPAVTVAMEIEVPEGTEAANEVRSRVQKLVGDGGLNDLPVGAAGHKIVATQMHTDDIVVYNEAGVPDKEPGTSAVGEHAHSSTVFTTLNVALMTVGAAVLGAVVTGFIMKRKNRNVKPKKSFTRVAIAPRRRNKD